MRPQIGHMFIAIQQKLKCNVDLEEPTLIGLYNLNNASCVHYYVILMPFN